MEGSNGKLITVRAGDGNHESRPTQADWKAHSRGEDTNWSRLKGVFQQLRSWNGRVCGDVWREWAVHREEDVPGVESKFSSTWRKRVKTE